jgi:hypothetical protein
LLQIISRNNQTNCGISKKENNVRLPPDDEAETPQPALSREQALRRLAALLDMHWKRGTSPNNQRQGMYWTNDNIARALEWKVGSQNTFTQRIKRMRCATKPSRPNDTWFNSLLISFFGTDMAALDDQVRAERAELIALHAATAGRPRPVNTLRPAPALQGDTSPGGL